MNKTSPPTVIYGISPVTEALKARTHAISRVLVAEGPRHPRIVDLLSLARAQGVPVRFMPKHAIDREAATTKHQGVAAVVATKGFAPIEEVLSVSDPDRLLLILDGIEDPRNLGAVIRSAHCAGAGGLIVPKHRAAGLTSAVEKTSAGALEYLPVARVTNIASLLEELKDAGFLVLGVDPKGQEVYTEVDLCGRIALVFGVEGEGLRRLTRERCDRLLRIPLHGQVDSLNLAVAAGIVMFEAVRQRQARKRL
ncbi:MAG: 23S rRNA (guanosine(2251)-2'-O)-methyltransferase RlmB [Acidobacteria bacterium]|nr:23S rRNA (guanosine(2251)-2'-O)-methyltransferase RlmB [Acidobacteriota bacterium]